MNIYHKEECEDGMDPGGKEKEVKSRHYEQDLIGTRLQVQTSVRYYHGRKHGSAQ